MNISSQSTPLPVDGSLKKDQIKQSMADTKAADKLLKPNPQAEAKDQAKLAALGKTGQAQASLSLDPEFNITRTKKGAQITGFPAGNPPAFESILREMFPNAQSIKEVSSESQRPVDKAVFEVDGQPIEVSFLWGGFLPGSSVDVTPLAGKLPPFTEHQQPSSGPDKIGKKTPLSDPGQLFPKSEPIAFDVKPRADGGFDLSGFPAGNPPPLKAVLAEIFPAAKSIEITSESHDRPFDTYQFQVDGQNYEYQFLFGGIVASSQASITRLD